MIELLQYVFAELEKREIAYLLSGSIALNSYTVPRFTRDIDVVIDLRTDNFAAFSEIFVNLDCYFHRESAEQEILRGGMFNVIDWKSGYKIDFITKKNVPFHEAEFSRKQRKTILDVVDCWVISPEDLILAKLIWIQELFSQQQARDIQNLIQDHSGLDRQYIRDWVNRLTLNTYNLLKP